MNLTIKLTSLISLILKSPRILQCHHGTNNSKEKEKKDTLTKMPLPKVEMFCTTNTLISEPRRLFFVVFFNLSGVLTLITLQILQILTYR